jgi:hypothetical protein
MITIPLIYLNKRKIYTKQNDEEVSLQNLFESVDKENKIYIYDVDGITRDKPNLCTYPKLSEKFNIWIDNGPRNLGDVVDACLAGASSIILRNTIWPGAEISKIREITDNPIYEIYSSQNRVDRSGQHPISQETDGFVIISNKNKTEQDYVYNEEIKTMCKKYNVLVIEPNEMFFTYWKNIGASGMIIELNNWKKVKNGEF